MRLPDSGICGFRRNFECNIFVYKTKCHCRLYTQQEKALRAPEKRNPAPGKMTNIRKGKREFSVSSSSFDEHKPERDKKGNKGKRR